MTLRRSVLRRVEVAAVLKLLDRVAQRGLAVHAVLLLLPDGDDLPAIARLVARQLQLARATRVVRHQLALTVSRRLVQVCVLLIDRHYLSLLRL